MEWKIGWVNFFFELQVQVKCETEEEGMKDWLSEFFLWVTGAGEMWDRRRNENETEIAPTHKNGMKSSSALFSLSIFSSFSSFSLSLSYYLSLSIWNNDHCNRCLQCVTTIHSQGVTNQTLQFYKHLIWIHFSPFSFSPLFTSLSLLIQGRERNQSERGREEERDGGYNKQLVRSINRLG